MTQNARLLTYLEDHPEGITTLEAFSTLRICRLSERIREIQRFYPISHEREKTSGGASVVRYRLEKVAYG